MAIRNYEETHRKHWAQGDGPGLVGPHRDGPAPCCLGHIRNTQYRPVIVMNLHLACSFAVGIVPHWTSWSHPLPQHPGFGWLLGERGRGPRVSTEGTPAGLTHSVTRDALWAPEGWGSVTLAAAHQGQVHAAGVVAAPDLSLGPPPSVWSAPRGAGR